MKKRLRFINTAVFLSILMSCNSEHAGKIVLQKVNTISHQYASIDSIFTKNDITFIDISFIEFLTGDSAIRAAENAHQADTFQTKDGKTHIDVANDYFIVNTNKKLLHVPLAERCTFDLVYNPDDSEVTDNSLLSLKKIYKNRPFIITFDKNVMVINIKEIFLP